MPVQEKFKVQSAPFTRRAVQSAGNSTAQHRYGPAIRQCHARRIPEPARHSETAAVSGCISPNDPANIYIRRLNSCFCRPLHLPPPSKHKKPTLRSACRCRLSAPQPSWVRGASGTRWCGCARACVCHPQAPRQPRRCHCVQCSAGPPAPLRKCHRGPVC